MRVARKRLLNPPDRVMDAMLFGRVRHSMFERETKETSRLPKIIAEESDIADDIVYAYVEPEFYVKAKIPGVGWIHSTLDGLIRAMKTIVDYKTTKNEAVDFDEYQLFVYALVCKHAGIDIASAWIIAEQWDDARTKILGYDHVQWDITDKHLEQAHGWLKKRAKLLKDALATLVPIYNAINSHDAPNTKPNSRSRLTGGLSGRSNA